MKNRRLLLWAGAVAFLGPPLCCCVVPPVALRITHGNFPIRSSDMDKVREGMTADEVQAILGTPHERHPSGDGEATWYYYCDSFGLAALGIGFGPDGRVKNTWW